MNNLISIKQQAKYYFNMHQDRIRLPRLKRKSDPAQAGFTLIELIVVILIIAVLSAIVAPGWLAFINRQRVAKVNDAIFSSIQEAQREARRTKRSYKVSFRENNNVPEVAIYRAEDDDGSDITLASDSSAWQSLGKELGIKEGQVILCSNLDDTNDNINSGSTTCTLSDPRTITFDYQGNLEGEVELGDTDPKVLAVTVAIPESNSDQDPIPATARCVLVKTIIGSMQIGKDEYDANSNPQGCPL